MPSKTAGHVKPTTFKMHRGSGGKGFRIVCTGKTEVSHTTLDLTDKTRVALIHELTKPL
jgi:hypothetical protein